MRASRITHLIHALEMQVMSGRALTDKQAYWLLCIKDYAPNRINFILELEA